MRIFCYLLLLLTGCTSRGQTTFKDKKNEFVLINSNGEKCEVARLIETLRHYQPRVIGINLRLNSDTDTSCNSLLIHSLEKTNHVVLVEGVDDKLSDENFYKKAFDTGETGLVRYDSRFPVETYYRLSEYRGRPSFPFIIAIQYDTAKELQLRLKTRRGQYPIVSNYRLNELQTLDPRKIDAKLVKDKIVLIGNLDSTSSNNSLTKFSNGSSFFMNRTVIEGNVILSILKDLDTPDAKPNKYVEFILREG